MILPGDRFPPKPNETREEWGERMAAIARAAFSGPAQAELDTDIDHDGDGGREWRDSRGLP